MVKTGDVVLYRYRFAAESRPDEAVVMAAIVTCTHEDWSPGYHGADGTWVPDTNVPQPAKDHVHLTWFSPTPGTAPTVVADVPHKSVAKAGESYFEERA